MTSLPIQILLFLVIFLITTVLTLCGIQVFHILRDLRESVKKANKMLDDFGIISESVAKPISGISGFLTGLKSGAEIINLFKRGKKE